jgi:ribosomal protein S18 acetylase RimI-like enzyme
VTDLTRLDGPGAAAVREQLVAVYRAAMGAAPFFETEVETGWFAEELAGELDEAGYRCWMATEDGRVVGFAYGLPTPEIPSEGWYGLVREAVGPAAAERWLAGQFAVVWIAVHPDHRGKGLGRRLLERLLAEAGTERAWLITHDLDTPARALYRSLGFQQLGRGPLGWHDADRVVLGAQLDPGRPEPDPPDSGPPVGEATSRAE